MCYYGFEQAEWVLCWYMCHSIPGYCEHMFDVISLYSSPLPYQQPPTIDFKTEIIVFPIRMFWWGGCNSAEYNTILNSDLQFFFYFQLFKFCIKFFIKRRIRIVIFENAPFALKARLDQQQDILPWARQTQNFWFNIFPETIISFDFLFHSNSIEKHCEVQNDI